MPPARFIPDVEFAPAPIGTRVRMMTLLSIVSVVVAATVVLRFFEELPSLQSATVMVQAEVADRMAAEPGVKAQFMGGVSHDGDRTSGRRRHLVHRAHPALPRG